MIDTVLAQLDGVRKNGNGWEAQCPAHADRRQSLSVSVGDDDRVLVRCYVGCKFAEIVKSAGLKPGDFFAPNGDTNGYPQSKRIVATYDYTDDDDAILLQVCRMQPKGFMQRRPDGRGGWIWGTKGIRRVLYRLPELLRAPTDSWVFLVEGEKDAGRLADAGLVATTCLIGAGKWRQAYNKPLAGRRIAILSDNDEPGRKHADEVARSLHGTAAEVRILELPGLPEKGDVSDWLDAGHTAQDLLERTVAAPPYVPPTTSTVPAAPTSDEPHPTDMGNAKRFAAQHADSVRFVHAWQKWLVWDGRRWDGDETGAVERLAKATVAQMFTDAVALTNTTARDALLKHAMASEGAPRIAAMIRLAESEPGIPIRPGQLDSDPLVLNVPNGTIDLRTGDLRKHRRDDHITKLAMTFRRPGVQDDHEARFDPEASCPRWDVFLDEVFDNSVALTTYVRRMVGYTLTGLVDEHALFFLHGSGANGKTTFLSVVQALVGDYGRTAAPGLLIRRSGEEHPTGLADLYGARFVSSVETGESRRLDEEKVKWITGGDTIKARRMREDFFDFSPSHKLYLASNHKPVVRGTDEGMWRRIHLVPFTVEFPTERQDPNLTRKLLDELPGIAAWAVAGCREWLERRLDPPAEVVQATQGYRTEMDVFAQWVADCCVTGDDYSARASHLLDSYREHSGQRTTSQWLGRRLAEHGFTKSKSGTVSWSGIGLATKDPSL